MTDPPQTHLEPNEDADTLSRPPELREPGHRVRTFQLRVGHFLRRHPGLLIVPFTAYAIWIAADAYSLIGEITAAAAKENAAAYAQIIPTLLIALMVEAVWLLRSADTYLTDRELAADPEGRTAISVWIVAILVVAFLFSAEGEIAALRAMNSPVNAIAEQTAHAPVRAICIQLFILAFAFLTRLVLVPRTART